MAKLEIPVVADISEIESLIDEIKHLQTYKLSCGDEQILIDRDDVIKIFAAHVRANIEPERKKGKWIKKMKVTKTEKYIAYDPEWYCPCCGTKYDPYMAKIVKFCYVCGEKMEAEE